MLDNYLKSGEIAKNIKKDLSKLLYPEIRLLNIAEYIERRALPAFPCNLCLNEVIAFYTPTKNDCTCFNSEDLLKIDFGVRYKDYIVDTALTIAFHNSELIKACKEALEKTIEIIKPEITVGEIGAKIQEVVESYGFKTFHELYGHSISKGTLHSFLTIPNVATQQKEKIRSKDVLAIEVFATEGKGEIKAINKAYIYKFLKPAKSKLFYRYSYYPFAERWLDKEEKEELYKLIRAGVIYPFNIIIEKTGARVAHFEETVIVTKHGCKIIT